MLDRLVGAGGTLDSAWGLRHETSSMALLVWYSATRDAKLKFIDYWSSSDCDRFFREEVDQSVSLLLMLAADTTAFSCLLFLNKWASLGLSRKAQKFTKALKGKDGPALSKHVWHSAANGNYTSLICNQSVFLQIMLPFLQIVSQLLWIKACKGIHWFNKKNVTSWFSGFPTFHDLSQKVERWKASSA